MPGSGKCYRISKWSWRSWAMMPWVFPRLFLGGINESRWCPWIFWLKGVGPESWAWVGLDKLCFFVVIWCLFTSFSQVSTYCTSFVVHTLICGWAVHGRELLSWWWLVNILDSCSSDQWEDNTCTAKMMNQFMCFLRPNRCCSHLHSYLYISWKLSFAAWWCPFHHSFKHHQEWKSGVILK